MAANKVEELTVTVAGVRVFYRRVRGSGTPTVYCHGNPTDSEQWLPFLLGGGPAIALDMPGWGRSGRPDPAGFDYRVQGLGRFMRRCLDELEVGPCNLVVQDWGSVHLVWAKEAPEAVERLVLINALPLDASYRWHWIGRIWRRRGIAEAMAPLRTGAATRLVLRQARAGPPPRSRHAFGPPLPRWFADSVVRRWDAGTDRAILALYRDADPDRLAAAGAGLEALSAPALALIGEQDPYIAPEVGSAFARRLPNVAVEPLADAGHWPWLDRPDVVDRVLGFLAADT